MWLWSWLLTVVGASGFFLAGSKSTRLYGWGVGIFVQLLWIAYALSSGQLGFLFGVLLYGSIAIRNFRNELKERSS